MRIIGTGIIRSYSSQLKLPDCHLAAVRVSSSNSGSLLGLYSAAFHPSWEAQITVSLDSTVSTPVIWALFFLCHFYHVLFFFTTVWLFSLLLYGILITWLYAPTAGRVCNLSGSRQRYRNHLAQGVGHSHYWEVSSGSDVHILSVFL